MRGYKAAKEAFVADNPGSSIWRINLVSFAALSCYVLYARFGTGRRDTPIRDYILTVLPLLLSVTIASTQPLFLNILLLTPVFFKWVSHLSSPTHSQQKAEMGSSHSRSKGQWLDESDSDEEPAQPASVSPLDTSGNANLPSELLPSPIERDSGASSPSLSPDPGKASKRATWRKRHSPTPSTHTHTAIDILPTPETATRPSMDSDKDDYPARRLGGTKAAKGGDGKMPFLSVYRAHMMIMTIHCILAVDFPVFPRWLGKCEDFGTSLMDVGVGSFVFSLGIVSTRTLKSSQRSLLVDALRSLRKSIPMLLLGFVRVLMVKGTEYPEHVTEYGVHWNFFFTLGLLPFFGTLLAPLRISLIHWTGLGVLLAILHQITLTSTSLQAWTLSTTRTGLIGMNKEGLVSLSGYIAIYLIGLGTGEHISHASSPPNDAKKAISESAEQHLELHIKKRRTELAMELFGYSAGWWSILALCRYVDLPVSRRLANGPYVIWIAAYNSTFLLGYLIIELTCFPPNASGRACPPLLEAINANGLVVFLVANLLTGLVNVSMQTMYAGTLVSMAVLVTYSIGVCGIAWIMRKKRLKL